MFDGVVSDGAPCAQALEDQRDRRTERWAICEIAFAGERATETALRKGERQCAADRPAAGNGDIHFRQINHGQPGPRLSRTDFAAAAVNTCTRGRDDNVVLDVHTRIPELLRHVVAARM